MHTCDSQHLVSSNPHATTKVVGEYYKDRFPKGKGPSIKDIQNSISTELGFKVSYWKVWRGTEIAKALVRGTYKYGYAILDAYRYMLTTLNLEINTNLKLDENGRFKYFFIAYGALIRHFQHIRKVIAMNGTFLNSKYGGVLLSAVAQDAEDHIFSMSFCVADTECDASYRYFFEQISNFVDDTPELCIISDRNPSIKKMVEIVFPLSHYGCCMRHLGENIRNYIHNGKVVYHFYKAAKAYSVDEFNDHFNQIRNMILGALHIWNMFDLKMEQSIFLGNRYKIMTSNIAESINTIFLDERVYLITALFDELNRRYGEKFYERHNIFINASNIFVPKIERKIVKNANLGNKLLVHQTVKYEYIVTGHNAVVTINFQCKSCTRRVFNLDKILCPHSMAALRCKYGDDYGKRIYEYSSPYYKVKIYLFEYLKKIKPVRPEDIWKIPKGLLERKILPSHVEPGKVGRPRRDEKESESHFQPK
ncbi:uncharacterized protein LOC129890678 [Solanum dulcamara]|uniref:uncharacterized protein LOC129890678 n=1 Tax=Solanum dulcamara TaxID=45834 RepID=UPI00248677F0|nr:uncharacterized protein LOC129890678 [Solanum dulcamara]